MRKGERESEEQRSAREDGEEELKREKWRAAGGASGREKSYMSYK